MRTPAVLASFVAVALFAPAIHADEPAPAPPADRAEEPWHPKKELTTGTSDWIITGAGAAAALGASIVTPLPKHAQGGVLFDESARDALRLKSRWWRYTARDFSDVGVSLESTWPFLVDALVTAWYYRGNTKVALDMTLVNAEAFVLAASVQGWTNTLASRERPYGRLCGGEIPNASVDCDSNARFRSFFSGHSTLSFTSAGLMCSHHMGMELLGAPWDTVTCVSGFGVATVTALFRVMSDMHYATDVSVGAIVGTSFGLLVPWLHYRGSSTDIHVAPVGEGVGLSGVF